MESLHNKNQKYRNYYDYFLERLPLLLTEDNKTRLGSGYDEIGKHFSESVRWLSNCQVFLLFFYL